MEMHKLVHLRSRRPWALKSFKNNHTYSLVNCRVCRVCEGKGVFIY